MDFQSVMRLGRIYGKEFFGDRSYGEYGACRSGKSGNVNEETAKRLHACMTIFCHGAAMMASTGAASVPESAFDSLMSDVFLSLKEFYSRSSYGEEIDGGKNIKTTA